MPSACNNNVVVACMCACTCWLLVAAAATQDAAEAISVASIREPLERVAFGSCNDQSRAQPLWSSILAREPELWLWMGDVIYGDYKAMGELKSYMPPFDFFRDASPAMLDDKYAVQLAQPQYAQLQRQVPVIGIWDDHDYGRNDGDRTFAHRVQSQSLFLDFLNEPRASPRRRQAGVYTSHTIGRGDRTVKFILLDVRYHKDPYGTVDGDFLGPTQWHWLESQLVNSSAAFNVVVSSIQVLPADRFDGQSEQWHRFPLQRARLLRLLLQANAKGVILLSGDVHYAEINQIACDAYANLVTEITSSGMTHSVNVGRNRLLSSLPSLVFTIASYVLPWTFRPHHDDVVTGLNVGELVFDWDAVPVATATVRVFDADGVAQLSHTFASQYFVSSSDVERHAVYDNSAPTCVAIRHEAFALELFRRFLFVCVIALVLAAIPMTSALVLLAVVISYRRALVVMQTRQRARSDLWYRKIE